MNKAAKRLIASVATVFLATTAMAALTVEPAAAAPSESSIVQIARREFNDGTRNYEIGTNCSYYGGVMFGWPACGGRAGWGGGTSDYAWCAAFAKYVWREGGVTSYMSELNGWAQSFKSYGQAHGTWHARGGYVPRPGDAVVFDWDHVADSRPIDHVGIVESVSGSSMVTIEGNISDRVVRRTWTNYAGNADIIGFTTAVGIVASVPAQAVSVVGFGDFTGDGKDDIGAQYVNGDLRVWAGTGDLSADGRLFGGSNALIGTGWQAGYVERILVGDFTGDGKADVGAQYVNGDLRVWASTGDLSADGRLLGGATALAGTGWQSSFVQRILVGDFTGDGKDDIAAQYVNGDLRVWASTGDLSADGRLFGGSTALAGTGWQDGYVERIVVGDFTGDGKDDISAQYANGDLRVWASTGDLSADGRLFGAGTALVGTGWQGSYVQRILVGDFTGDGKADVGAQYVNGEVRVWASTGDLSADGRLLGGSTALTGTGWQAGYVERILVGDFTGDGKDDISAQYVNGDLRVWASTGDLSADGRLFGGSTALAGTGWQGSYVQRII